MKNYSKSMDSLEKSIRSLPDTQKINKFKEKLRRINQFIEKLIKSPAHWLGNINFSNFTGSSIFRLKTSEFNKALVLNRPNYDILKSEINKKNNIVMIR